MNFKTKLSLILENNLLNESSFKQNISSLINKNYEDLKNIKKIDKLIDNFSFNSEFNIENKLTLLIANETLKFLINQDIEQVKEILTNPPQELKSKLEYISDIFNWYGNLGKNKEIILQHENEPVIKQLIKYMNSKFNPQNMDYMSNLFKFLHEKNGEITEVLEDVIETSRDTSEFIPKEELNIDGKRYASYEINNKEQAINRCWLSDPSKSDQPVYCITSKKDSEYINEYGGYPFYMIMVGPTQKQEEIFAAYLPNALDIDIDNALRNRANTDKLEPKKVEKILPLLIKTDIRIKDYIMEYLPFTMENIKKYNYDLMKDKNENLFKASNRGSLEVVKFLIENGADIHVRNDLPLRVAALHGHLEIIKFLVENGANIHSDMDESLRFAAMNGHLKVVKFLVENGADIYARNDIPLRNAALHGHLEVVKFLVENGVDIHALDDHALKNAALHGHLEVVKFLVENGADIHAGNDLSLRFAAMNGHLEIVNFLVKNGADIHAKNDKALREAAANGHLEVIKFLVENGANIHAKDDYALRYAAESGHDDVVNYLKSVIEKEKQQLKENYKIDKFKNKLRTYLK